MRSVLLAALLLMLPFASAGTPGAPEMTDAEGDCALPYAASYLDLVAVWIENEDESSFEVVTRLASFDETAAEGAGYTIQFEHQRTPFGVVAVYRPMSAQGWEFYTGRVDAREIESDTLTPRAGSFDPATATFRILFPKSLFLHRDAADRTLRSFYAGSADLRPAYPFLLAGDRVVDGSSNGKWLVCDEAESSATYVFASGTHSAEHEAPATAAGSAEAPAEAPFEAAAPRAPEEAAPDGTRDVPVPAWLALAALAFSGVGRSRPR